MKHDLEFSPELKLPADAVTQKFAFLAQSGAGKTYGAMKLAELMLAIGAQVVAVDPVGVWWALRAGADGKSTGFPIHVFGGEHGDLPLRAESGELVARVIVEQRISVVLDLSEFTTAETKRFVTAFAEAFFQLKKRSKSPVHVFFEEAQTVAPQVPERDEGVMLNRVERLLKLGRNYGIGWTLISQQPQAVHKRCLNQAGCLIALRTLGKHERKAVSEWVSDKATSQTELDLLGELPSLAIGEAFVWSPGWLRLTKRIRIGKRVTFDASATPDFGGHSEPPRKLAPVDLEQIRGAMAEVVARAEGEDPKALQKRIRQLEAELAQVKRAAPAPSKPIEVPVLSDEQFRAISSGFREVTEAIGPFNTKMIEIGDLLDGAMTALKKPRALALQPARAAPANVHRERPAIRAVPAERVPRTTDGGGLPKGERAVLTAIAQHEGGVTREQLTVLTGYKRSSRDTYLQRLRERGLIAAGEPILATDEGFAELGPDFEPLPTGGALLEHWRARLPAGERACLDVLVERYPRAVPRDHVGEATGYLRSSRDTYLQRLRARQLITEPSRGQVRASDALFDDAREVAS